jgi:F-type H+-transporting ATPase subunit delta
MISSKITNRYAKAFLDLAIENNQLNDSYRDLCFVDETCSECVDFTLMLKSPIINSDKKLKIIKSIFEKKISNLTMLFIEIITVKKREALLHSISKNFIQLYKSHNNIISASVTTASSIEDSTRNRILSFIKAKADKEVELKENINPKIIGGSIIRLGDFQWDNSVRKDLKKLKNSYNKNLYIKDF